MTPPEYLARALAAALLDGEWEARAMLARLREALGCDRPWMRSLVRAARRKYAAAPARSVGELGAWVYSRPAFRDATRERLQVVHYPMPAPAMAESPWSVPPIATSRDLAAWLGIELDAMEVLADRLGISRTSKDPRARHYHYAWIPKATGGHRLVEAPKVRLRTVQRQILDGIVAHIPSHDAAHGFREGRSVITFAEPHVGRAVVLRVDLQAFFSSVFGGRVIGILRTAGYPEEIACTLAALCTHRTPSDVLARAPERVPLDLARLRTPHLPQGAPTSGALANLAAYRLDVRIAAFARRLGATYTRYADDLVLSGGRRLACADTTIVGRLAAIAAEEGFAVNFRKTRVMTASTRQRVTGIVVNNKLSVSRDEVERLRAILHNCRRHGPATQNREQHPDFRAHLRGRVAWIESVDPAKGARLRAVFDAVRWE